MCHTVLGTRCGQGERRAVLRPAARILNSAQAAEAGPRAGPGLKARMGKAEAFTPDSWARSEVLSI